MLTLLFVILTCVIFGHLISLAVKMAWGLTKVLVRIVLPVAMLVLLAACGLVWAALLALAVIGIVSLVTKR